MSEHLPSTVKYFYYLVEQAERLIADKQYEQVSFDVLTNHNNMRSGWTTEIAALFSDPQTPAEKKLVERMTKVIEQTIAGLLEIVEPGPSFMQFAMLEHIAVQLDRLGEKAPQEMIDKTRVLLEQSQDMGAPEFLTISVPALELLQQLNQLTEPNQKDES